MKKWFHSGTPWIWLNAGALSLCLVMVVGLLALIAIRGFSHFWPADITQFTMLQNGSEARVMGELVRSETLAASVIRESGVELKSDDPLVTRHLLKIGNRDVFGRDFVWYLAPDITSTEYPNAVLTIERREWGNFYGFPIRLLEGDQTIASNNDIHYELSTRIKRVNDLFAQIRRLEKSDIGDINYQLQQLKLREKVLQLDKQVSEQEKQKFAQEAAIKRENLETEFLALRNELDQLYSATKRDKLIMATADGREVTINLGTVVDVWAPNQMSVFQKLLHYFGTLWHFLSDEPREANTEGGIFPAIFGTITMVLLMTLIVTPFGVLAAIYLREYAKQGPLLKIIRVSVYNLAGVP